MVFPKCSTPCRKHLPSLYFVLFPQTGNLDCHTAGLHINVHPSLLSWHNSYTSQSVCALIQKQQQRLFFHPPANLLSLMNSSQAQHSLNPTISHCSPTLISCNASGLPGQMCTSKLLILFHIYSHLPIKDKWRTIQTGSCRLSLNTNTHRPVNVNYLPLCNS